MKSFPLIGLSQMLNQFDNILQFTEITPLNLILFNLSRQFIRQFTYGLALSPEFLTVKRENGISKIPEEI